MVWACLSLVPGGLIAEEVQGSRASVPCWGDRCGPISSPSHLRWLWLHTVHTPSAQGTQGWKSSLAQAKLWPFSSLVTTVIREVWEQHQGSTKKLVPTAPVAYGRYHTVSLVAPFPLTRWHKLRSRSCTHQRHVALLRLQMSLDCPGLPCRVGGQPGAGTQYKPAPLESLV